MKASTKKKKKGSGEKKKKAKKEKRKKSGKTKKYIEGEKASIGMTISDMVTRLVDLNIIQVLHVFPYMSLTHSKPTVSIPC